MNSQLQHNFSNPDLPLFLVIDLSNVLYRNYHALKAQKRSFNAPDGTPTGALMLTINKIERTIATVGPDHVIVVQEGGGKQARQKIYSEYKSLRTPADEDLKIQMKLAAEILPIAGFHLLKKDDLEADDLMIGFGLNADKLKYNCLLQTTDKDMYQAISSNCEILPLDFKEPKTISVKECFEKFKVLPTQIVDYLALLGDSVDQIPGVPKIGDKTASKLLHEHGSLLNILNKAHERQLSDLLNNTFTQYKDQALISQQLASPFPFTPTLPLPVVTPQWDELYEKLTQLGFKSTLGLIKKRQKETKQNHHNSNQLNASGTINNTISEGQPPQQKKGPNESINETQKHLNVSADSPKQLKLF